VQLFTRIVLELIDCQEILLRTPSQIVLEQLKPNHLFTGVHCTYTEQSHFNSLLQSGANICICPLTEGNAYTL
jgi:hypothetical protein